MYKWLILIFGLSADNATLRMRVWRGIKACGAATLRDGVYLLPNLASNRDLFQRIADEVLAAGGSAYLLEVTAPDEESFVSLFDRSEGYLTLLSDIDAVASTVMAEMLPESLKQVRKLRKTFAALTDIDFFPGQARQQVEAAFLALEARMARLSSPDEPHSAEGGIPRLNVADYQGRCWATRRRPWVDRLASAWLISRHIDKEARFLWLATPEHCPDDALGFDFDGAMFTHMGSCVSFEVLLASFGLRDPALARLAGIVHFLDVGGVQPPAAAGIEQLLAGLRDSISDDDQLLHAASFVFDGLLVAFQKTPPS